MNHDTRHLQDLSLVDVCAESIPWVPTHGRRRNGKRSYDIRSRRFRRAFKRCDSCSASTEKQKSSQGHEDSLAKRGGRCHGHCATTSYVWLNVRLKPG